MSTGRLTVFAACSALLAAGVAAGVGRADDSPYLNVWVHYDYMVTPDHSDAPSSAAIKIVVDAFKSHGVTLHIDPQHTAIPAHAVIVADWPGDANGPGFDDPACTGPDAVLFSALKAQYFQPNSNHPWHYAVFGEHVITDTASDANHCPALANGRPPLPNMTGYSQLGFGGDVTQAYDFGYDFVVAMGSFLDYGHTLTDTAVAALFMHELGHNLGLQHGGVTPFLDDNYKPNYISVMNYDFLFGIPYASTPGSTVIAGYRVDYSDVKLPDLNEADLDENVGVQDTAHPTDITYSCADPFCSTPIPALGPVDWNGNGTTTDTHVVSDLNSDLDQPPNALAPYPQILHGSDDWTWIHARLIPPTVTGFCPATVTPGESIGIVGSNLYNPATVLFGGGVTATGDGNQPGPISCEGLGSVSLDVTVPAGARSGPISVVTSEAKATSTQTLTITP